MKLPELYPYQTNGNIRNQMYMDNAIRQGISGGGYGAFCRKIYLVSGTEDLWKILDSLIHELMHQLLDELFPHATIALDNQGKPHYFPGGTVEGSTCRAWDNVIGAIMEKYRAEVPFSKRNESDWLKFKSKFGVH